MKPLPDFHALLRYRDEQVDLLRARRIMEALFRRRIRKAVKAFNQQYDAAFAAQQGNGLRQEGVPSEDLRHM